MKMKVYEKNSSKNNALQVSRENDSVSTDTGAFYISCEWTHRKLPERNAYDHEESVELTRVQLIVYSTDVYLPNA